MAAGDPILSLSDLILLATGGGSGAPEQVNFCKKALIAGAAPGTLVAGRITSLWKYDGQPSAATSTPTTAVVVTNATDGSLKQTTSASSTKKRLLSLTAIASAAGSLIVYDRLVQHGGMDATVITAQTTNFTGGTTPALTRRTSGVGVEAWIEVYTQIGASSTTATISYTDTTPTSGNTSPAFSFGNTGFREQDRIIPVPLAAGDLGVTSVQNVDLLATTATAGNFGVTLAYPLLILPMSIAGVGYMWSGIGIAGGPLDLGATSDACLAFAWHPNGATAPELFGQAFFLEK